MTSFLNPFRFRVEFFEPDTPKKPTDLISAAFSECTGLDATMETKEIKSGGWNYGPIQRAGRTSFSTVILKRGITENRGLWSWFHAVADGAYAYRLNAVITMLRTDQQVSDAKGALQWELQRALPTKFKTADLNAKTSEVAIEELHFVHEGLTLKHPEKPKAEAG